MAFTGQHRTASQNVFPDHGIDRQYNIMPDNDDLSAPTYSKGGEPSVEIEQNSADLI